MPLALEYYLDVIDQGAEQDGDSEGDHDDDSDEDQPPAKKLAGKKQNTAAAAGA